MPKVKSRPGSPRTPKPREPEEKARELPQHVYTDYVSYWVGKGLEVDYVERIKRKWTRARKLAVAGRIKLDRGMEP